MVWSWKNLETIVRYCYYIWRCIEFLIRQPSNNSGKSCYQASEEFVLLLPYKFATRKYTCQMTNDVTCSRSIHAVMHDHNRTVYDIVGVAI